MFKEIIVVEGRDDTRRLKEVFGVEIQTFETGGSDLNAQKIAQIKKLQQEKGVIVLTDPDYPGQKIRNEISQAVPEARHAYLDKDDAIHKRGKGLGVEHASSDAIKQALSAVMTPTGEVTNEINQAFLVSLDLIGHQESKKKREILAKRLGIGYVNGKQLEKRLNMFGISKVQVIEALSEEK